MSNFEATAPTLTNLMTSLLIENSRVLDVHALTLRTGLSVLVQDGRIAAVGTDLQVPEGTTTLDAKGMTLMPGLIDCHVHVVASSFNLGAVAKMPNVFTMMRSLPIMKGMLERGFTTVRDAGGADWSLAEAVRTGLVQGPRIFPAGKALSQTGGHADFRQRNDDLDVCSCAYKLGNIGRVVDGVDACRLAVREEILKGATQIKVMASGGVASPNDPIGNLGYSEAELLAMDMTELPARAMQMPASQRVWPRCPPPVPVMSGSPCVTFTAVGFVAASPRSLPTQGSIPAPL